MPSTKHLSNLSFLLKQFVDALCSLAELTCILPSSLYPSHPGNLFLQQMKGAEACWETCFYFRPWFLVVAYWWENNNKNDYFFV